MAAASGPRQASNRLSWENLLIFLTVGSGPFPFDRLITAADRIANTCGHEFVIQKGCSSFSSSRCKIYDFIPYRQLIAFYRDADLIISHTSSGPLTYARFNNKPIITLPRDPARREIIDDHQLQVARALTAEHEPMRRTIFNADDLGKAFSAMLKRTGGAYQKNEGLNSLIKALRGEIQRFCRNGPRP
jgi:UDP-N-acetylglucosamine transferase subunit ALG13